MGRITANGVELEYGTFGSPDDPTVLLVAGLGMQMTGWHEEFCGELAARGFHVVRYDNRDCGLSGGPADPPQPDFAAIRTGDYSSAAYTIPDLALDAVGLLDGLGVEAAHVVGVSMGGMIVQQLAIDHPERVLSLCSVMSTPGRTRGRSTPQAQAVLFRPPGTTREEVIEQGLETWTVIGSPDYPADPEELRARVTAEYDRAFRPDGTARQLTAIMASPERTEALARVTAPTLVIHGTADQLITPDGGEATAEAVPGAELLMVPGMGHDLPRPLWPTLIDAIARNAKAV